MNTLSLALVGAGRAGGSLARHWHSAQAVFEVTAFLTRSGNAALAADTGITESQSLDSLPDVDVVLIASGDGAIADIANSLAVLGHWDWQNKIVFHLSGALASTVLQPLADRGALTASAHPVRAFSTDRGAIRDTWVGTEGDAQALEVIEAAFDSIGARCFRIDSRQKTSYHAAAVVASNHMIALAQISTQLWQKAGVAPEIATALYDSLARSVLDNLADTTPLEALTGPIARGDASTVARHIRALESESSDIADVYRQLSSYLIDATSDQKTDKTNAELHRAIASRNSV